MSLNDTVNYLLFKNPVSQGLFSATTGLARSVGIISKQNPASPKVTNIMSNSLPLWRLAGSNLHFVRAAGVSGAAAVVLGAYGSHRKYNDVKGESKAIFETANRFHFFHSIALMAVPMVHRPLVTGSLMIFGTTLFSGVLYYSAFTGDRKYSSLAPIGGYCLILAWLSMVL